MECSEASLSIRCVLFLLSIVYLFTSPIGGDRSHSSFYLKSGVGGQEIPLLNKRLKGSACFSV